MYTMRQYPSALACGASPRHEQPGAEAAEASEQLGTPPRIPTPRKPIDDATWPLMHCREAPRTAREIAANVLGDWQVGETTTEITLLVVSEMVTNAVEHAQPPVALHLHRERAGTRIWVGVTDGGPSASEGAWTASCAGDEHGRGLGIIDALTATHGVRAHQGGTTHWARLRTAA